MLDGCIVQIFHHKAEEGQSTRETENEDHSANESCNQGFMAASSDGCWPFALAIALANVNPVLER